VTSPHHDYAKKFIEVAESDLKATEVLLKSGMYPQAIFLIQQALEKAIKAIALELNLITPEDVGKELGHYVVERLIDYVVNESRCYWCDAVFKCCKGNRRCCKGLKDFEFGVGYWLAWILIGAKEFNNVAKIVEKYCEKTCTVSLPSRQKSEEGEKDVNIEEALREAGHLILIDDQQIQPFKSIIEEISKCYKAIVCKLLRLPENEMTMVVNGLVDAFSNITSYSNLEFEKCESFADCPVGKPGDVERICTLNFILSHLLAYYAVYEPFAVNARYPTTEICSPLDIKEGTFIVKISEQLIRSNLREVFTRAKEFIEGSTKTKQNS